jgi:hypothetical protein
MDDQFFYQKIGQLLIDAGPSNACKIIVRAELFPDNDGGKYEFDYYDRDGNLSWLDPDGRAIADLTDLLISLRKLHLENNFSSEDDTWIGCVISLDIDSMKFNLKLNYKD